MSIRLPGMFRSLGVHNYRVWAAGALVSNIGTWLQRTAQDWLVLTELTRHNASAVGLVMALQFAPQLIFLPWTGYAADRFNQRKLLALTQGLLGALSLVLGLLTVTGVVRLWQVEVFAFLFGTVAAFDMPVRQVFVSELVSEEDLPNAVGLNSTSFNAGRMIGPAVAGLLIAGVGTGWAFVLNGVSFVAVLISLAFLRGSELRSARRASRATGGFVEGFRYVWSRPDLKAIMVMLFLIGTFGLNFAIFISTMAVQVFHAGAQGYGALSSIMAVGSVIGALLAAGRSRPRFSLLFGGSAIFGIGCAVAALAPSYTVFACALVLVGVAGLTILNSSNSLMQLSTEPAMRGRVMALRMGVAMGGTPIGAPAIGWVADHFGPRWAMGVGAASGFCAAGVAIWVMARHLHEPPALAEPLEAEREEVPAAA